jgi:hypothetical protein
MNDCPPSWKLSSVPPAVRSHAVATDVGGPSFSLTTAHGLWASALYESLLVLFALAASVPHSAPVNTGAGGTVPAQLAHHTAAR